MRWNIANPAPFVLIMLILSQGCGGGDSSTTPITPGSVTLNQDMTCSRSITATATATDGGTSMTITTTGEGTYTHTNGAVTVTWAEDGSTDSGSIVSSQLTLTAEGDVLIFRK